jgi:hypothetical protein
VQVLEKRKRVLGQEHPDTLTSMGSLASTYSIQRRWKEAEELQIQLTNSLQTILGEDHPSIAVASTILALLRKKREMLRDDNTLEHGLREMLGGLSIQFQDRLLQYTIAKSVEHGNDGGKRSEHFPKTLQQSDDNDKFVTEAERFALALAMLLEVEHDNDTDQILRCALAKSVQGDEGNETNMERPPHGLVMSTEEVNVQEEINTFKREYSPEVTDRLIPVAASGTNR